MSRLTDKIVDGIVKAIDFLAEDDGKEIKSCALCKHSKGSVKTCDTDARKCLGKGTEYDWEWNLFEPKDSVSTETHKETT